MPTEANTKPAAETDVKKLDATAETDVKKLEATAETDAKKAEADAEKAGLKAITLSRDFTLNLGKRGFRELKKGLQYLETELHDHWFVKAHTVETKVVATVEADAKKVADAKK